MTFKDAAIKILSESKTPLHYREITQLALDNVYIETTGATPEATMAAQISTDIKTKKEKSSFIKVAEGTYKLNPDISFTEKPEEKREIEELEEVIKLESGYTGKAGEYLVCSSLLFRGFNASIMSVDVGLDIVATKDNKMFGIQVKTANLNKFDTYVFDVRKVSFERHSSGNVYYIFVLHDVNSTDFIILPFHELQKNVAEKNILEVGGGKRFRINIKVRADNVFLGNKLNNINFFKNNWDIIQ